MRAAMVDFTNANPNGPGNEVVSLVNRLEIDTHELLGDFY